jgi:hypothetical protein
MADLKEIIDQERGEFENMEGKYEELRQANRDLSKQLDQAETKSRELEVANS